MERMICPMKLQRTVPKAKDRKQRSAMEDELTRHSVSQAFLEELSN